VLRVRERPVLAPAPLVDPATPPPTTPPATIDSEGTLGAESRLLAAALHQLRTQRDPKAALVALDRYDAEFPHGALQREARRARIEALLASDHKREALAVLDTAAIGTDLTVLRGELRLEVGRVDDAAHDFEAALLGKTDAIEERALYGRAACRVRLGDRAGARSDLDDYLRRFPHGRRAAAARAARDAIDGGELLPAGSAAEGRRGSIDGRGR
jgi:hypothetical protein